MKVAPLSKKETKEKETFTASNFVYDSHSLKQALLTHKKLSSNFLWLLMFHELKYYSVSNSGWKSENKTFRRQVSLIILLHFDFCRITKSSRNKIFLNERWRSFLAPATVFSTHYTCFQHMSLSHESVLIVIRFQAMQKIFSILLFVWIYVRDRLILNSIDLLVVFSGGRSKSFIKY